MSKFLFAATALVAFATVGSAGAADLPAEPAYKTPAAVAPGFSWTGCYLGAGGGYGTWTDNATYETFPALTPLSQTVTSGGKGWFGTGQIGCDYQFGRLVVGAFGDGDVGSIKGNMLVPYSGEAGNANESSAWAAGGRVGLVVWPKFLAYVSGGYTEAHFDQLNLTNVNLTVPSPGLYTVANTYNGWFLGTGYEYGLDFLPGLFWKTEYRYASYSAVDLPMLLPGGVPSGVGFNSQKAIQTIRSELVWRFSWGSP
ncbi:MAG TPA: porin family protein [Xanthobacteraceae bacterium]|nr:porin family protein [Xanthobacteraceae bacterium]